MERIVRGSAQHSPEIETEVIGVRFLDLKTGHRWGGFWVGFQSFKCRFCGCTIKNPDLGELCECGTMVCTLIKFNLDDKSDIVVWERESLE